MTSLTKLVIVTAPAMALLFFFVIQQQAEHKAQMNLESARFDQEWAEWAKERGNSTFWLERQIQAKREEEEASKELEERKRKIAEFEKAFEKALNETETEIEKSSLKGKK